MKLNSNQTKDLALGMPHGTASNRLRKALLFKYIVKAEEDACFKCGQRIENIDDLSIEHKTPWLYSDDPSSLFFDLENVAFSHLKCNRPDTMPSGVLKRKIGPEGTAWCYICKNFLPIDRFVRSNNRWNGVQIHCKSCNNKKRRETRASKS